MANVKMKPATRDTVTAFLTPGLRAADCIEVVRSTGLRPETAVWSSVRASSGGCAVICHNELPVGILGLVDNGLLTGSAIPWFLANKNIEPIWVRFAKESKPIFEGLRSGYDHLYNWVDVDNRLSIRWLKWLGFTLSEMPVPLGPLGKPFYRFDWRV